MPTFRDGLVRVAFALIFGLIFSLLVRELLVSVIGEIGYLFGVLINIIIIIYGLLSMDRANYWSLSYTFGYLAGLVLFGTILMERWELLLYSAVVIFYILKKISKKI